MIQWFEAPAPPGGRNFLDILPKQWKPAIVYAEPIWEVDYDVQFSAQTTIRLDNFDFAEISGGSVDTAKKIGDSISSWIQRIPSAALEAQAQGFAWDTADRRSGVGHWLFRYDIDGIIGAFNVWIVPQTESSAILIASISERRIGAAT